MHHLLTDIGLSAIFAAVLGTIAYGLRQPTILGYFIAGALLGPGLGFGLVHDPESIETISEIGLILLLFVIGLEMNLAELAASGRQLIVTGVGQFLICAGLGFAFFSTVPIMGASGSMGALYACLLCALSSTAVVVKILSDKFEIDTRTGRLTIGVLVMQDLWAILTLALQPNFADPKLHLIGVALGLSSALVGFSYFASKYALRPIIEKASRSPEIVVLIAIGWCAGMVALARFYGLSMEMGALIAGATISAFPFRIHLIAKTLPLRDFFLTLFFVSLGMKLIPPQLDVLLGAAIIVAFIFASRFLSVIPLLKMSGAGNRTAIVTSLNLSQLSEFALVIAALGVELGHITDKFLAVLIYAMAISALISSYVIKFNHQIFAWISNVLKFDNNVLEPGEADDSSTNPRDIVLLGYHHSGREFVSYLGEKHPELLTRVQAVDYNVEALKELDGTGVKAVFGDLASFDTLHHAHLEHAKLILCTLPDILLKGTSNYQIVETCKAIAPEAEIFAIADNPNHRLSLLSVGATDAVLWYREKAETLAAILVARTQPTGPLKTAAA